MTKPVTPEQLVPGSQQGADPKPEDTVAGPNGTTTFTGDYLHRQKLGADAQGPKFDPHSPEAVAAGAEGFGEQQAQELADKEPDAESEDDESDEGEGDEEADDAESEDEEKE